MKHKQACAQGQGTLHRFADYYSCAHVHARSACAACALLKLARQDSINTGLGHAHEPAARTIRAWVWAMHVD